MRTGLDLADSIVIFASLVLAYWVRFHTGWFPIERFIPPIYPYLQTFALVSLFWTGILACTDTLSVDRNFTVGHLFALFRSVFIGAGLGMMAAFFYRGFSYSRLTVGIGLMLTMLCLAVWHYVKWRVMRALSTKGLGVVRALIVGDGRLARECLEQIRRSEEPFFRVVGYCQRREGALDGVLPDLGPREKLLDVVRDQRLDHVLIALPSAASEEILGIIQELDATSVGVTLIPDLFALIATSVQPGELMGIPAIHLNRLPIHGIGGQIKHFLDFWVALFALILLSPILLLVAIWIRRDSPGPALYVQERIGLDGRTFRMLKFRSMRQDAEAQTGPVWASENDPRRTRLGTFLRKYSIDELPQLVNVLKGEMSLVGPRPERPAFVEQFKLSIPRYMGRHKVRSGITGWAQISGLRGRSPIEERTRYDIWYIENWSLWLDFEIVLKTFHVCFFRPTGY